MLIRRDDLRTPEVVQLVLEHLENMAVASPPESVHALGLDELRGADVEFWTVWDQDELAGFGALKRLDAAHVEIKSMRTAQGHRRRGIGRRLLEHLLEEGKRRGFERVSLETGSQDVFEPARRLYGNYGFEVCGPFADYVDDPNSVYMTRAL